MRRSTGSLLIMILMCLLLVVYSKASFANNYGQGAASPEEAALSFLDGFFGGKPDLIKESTDAWVDLISPGQTAGQQERNTWSQDTLIGHAYTPNDCFHVTWKFMDTKTSYEGMDNASIQGKLAYVVNYKKGTFGISYNTYSVTLNRTFYLRRIYTGGWIIYKIMDWNVVAK